MADNAPAELRLKRSIAPDSLAEKQAGAAKYLVDMDPQRDCCIAPLSRSAHRAELIGRPGAHKPHETKR